MSDDNIKKHASDLLKALSNVKKNLLFPASAIGLTAIALGVGMPVGTSALLLAIGTNLVSETFSDLFKRIAQGKNGSQELEADTQKLNNLLETIDISKLTSEKVLQEIGDLVEKFDLIGVAINEGNSELVKQLAEQYGQHQALLLKIQDYIIEIRSDLRYLATAEQSQMIIDLLNRLIHQTNKSPYQLFTPIGMTKEDNLVNRPIYIDQIKKAIGIWNPQDAHGVTILHGIGGIGKTALAKMICDDSDVRFTFPYIFFLEVGQGDTDSLALQLMQRIGTWIGHNVESYKDIRIAQGTLQNYFKGKRVLIVLNDVWGNQRNLISYFRFADVDYRILITTRTPHLSGNSSDDIEIRKLSLEEGLQIMNFVRPYRDESEKSVYTEIFNLLDGHVLAIKIASQRLLDYTPQRLLERLKETWSEHNPFDDLDIDSDSRNDSLERSLKLSYDDLGGDDEKKRDNLQRRFRVLGIFTENSFILQDALVYIWDDSQIRDTEDAIIALQKAGLLEKIGERYTHHTLLKVYAHALLRRNNEYQIIFGRYANFFIVEAYKNGLLLNDKSDLHNIIKISNELVELTQCGHVGDYALATSCALLTSNYRHDYPENPHVWSWLDMGVNAINRTRLLEDYSLELEKERLYLLKQKTLQLRISGEIAKVIIMQQDILNQAIELDSNDLIISLLSDISLNFWRNNQHENALDYCNKVLSMNLEDLSLKANILNTRGLILSDLGFLTEALQDFQNCLSLSIMENSIKLKSTALYNIGTFYLKTQNFPKALQYLNKSLKIRLEIGYLEGEAFTRGALGRLNQLLGNYDEAKVFFYDSLNLFTRIGDKWNEASLYFNLAQLYESINQLDKAIECLTLCVDLDQKIQHPDLKSDTQYLTYLKDKRKNKK